MSMGGWGWGDGGREGIYPESRMSLIQLSCRNEVISAIDPWRCEDALATAKVAYKINKAGAAWIRGQICASETPIALAGSVAYTCGRVCPLTCKIT